MKRMLQISILVIVLFAVSTTLIVLRAYLDRSLKMLQEKDVIRIGYAIEAPYAFLDKNGAVTGESPEVAKQIVKKLGIHHIEWRMTEFGSLITGLESGQYDVIAAGMFITPERAKHILFSDPSFHVRESLLVAMGNPKALDSYTSLARMDNARVAVLTGSVEEGLMRGLGMEEAQLLRVPDALAGQVAVSSGKADALALSSPTIRWMSLKNQLGKTEMVEPQGDPSLYAQKKLGYGGFGFRLSDKQLQQAWNDAMKGFIGSPAHLELVSAFGFSSLEMPGEMTTKEVIQP